MSPCSPPIAVNRTLKTGSDGKDGHYYSFSGRIGRLYGGVNNKRNKYIRTLPVVLMVDDTVIGTLGNFSASIGKAKSKKTFNVSAIVASALSGSTVLHYRSMFPENKRKILYIDTEQGRYHCQQVLKRILRLADLPEYKNPDNLIMLALRKFSLNYVWR